MDDARTAYDKGDYEEALEIWRSLADQGNAKAQFNLGLMYDNGRGVTQDDKEAVKWYKLAANQGNAKAQFNLGVMYDNGEGVTQDDKEADGDNDQKKRTAETDSSLQTKIKNDVKNIEINDSSEEFSSKVLGSIRDNLLDLTNRNSLLNFKHPKISCVRLINELPNQIYQHLQDGKEFTFIPIAEPSTKELIDAKYLEIIEETGQTKPLLKYPSAAEWAKLLGLPISYDLPDDLDQAPEYTDANLQTLFYAPELEARLRKIRSNAERCIEESGINILYLALGYLEWYENDTSDVPRLSPLFTLPVQLKRVGLDGRTRAYKYAIQLKDDGLITNTTLQKRLANDFNLALPFIEESTKPEDYFKSIEENILKKMNKWKICRQASLVLLNFSKQAMYKDLDLDSWPEDSKIQKHLLIKSFLNASVNQEEEAREEYGYETEHVIDKINNVYQTYPLIYDADSSQHSAIIDVIEGKNLVIEGPPGSGKSQTIANIIAACIAKGMKVLFVAEKMAALNVVKNRLDLAGLGDFCFELHSHKTNKKTILETLKQRILNQNRYNDFVDLGINNSIEIHTRFRNTLNEYVCKMHSKWKGTDLTIHEIFQKATMLREKYKSIPDNLRIEGVNGENLTKDRRYDLAEYARTLEIQYSQVSQQAMHSQIKNHNWYGVGASELLVINAEQLISSLRNWSDSLSDLESTRQKLLTALGLENNDMNSLTSISQYTVALSQLPNLIGGEQLDKLNPIFEKHKEIQDWLETYKNLHSRIKEFQTEIYDVALIRNPRSPSVSSILKTLPLPDAYTLKRLEEDKDKVGELLELSEAIAGSFKEIAKSAPKGLKSLFSNSFNSLSEVTILIKQIKGLSPELWKCRDVLFDNDDLDALIELLAPCLKEIIPIHNRIKDEVSLDRLPDVKSLHAYQFTLNNAGFFKRFSSDWKQARSSVLSLSRKIRPNEEEFINLLPEIIFYARETEELLKINNNKEILGSQFKGVDTPIDEIKVLRDWYKSVRAEYSNIANRNKIGGAILSSNSSFFGTILSEENKDLLSNIELLLSGLKYLEVNYSTHPINGNDTGEIKELAGKITKISDGLMRIFKNKNCTLLDVKNHEVKINLFLVDSETWSASQLNKLIQPRGYELLVTPNDYSETNLTSAENTVRVSVMASQLEYIKNAITESPSKETYKTILDSVTLLNIKLTEELIKKKIFIDKGSLDLGNWLSATDGSIASIIVRNKLALENHQLDDWIQYIQLKHKLHVAGFGDIIQALENHKIESKDLGDIVNLAINYQLANEIRADPSYFQNFNGPLQTSNQREFKKCDANILQLQKQEIAHKVSRGKPSKGVKGPLVSNMTEMSLLEHELIKQKNHVAVRSLLKRAGQTIQFLKPCFMMSPMSVAQYLEPGKLKFDLVIMDEASQIRPGDALGAIARGKKLVVVGDSKQLPPTDFFRPEDEVDPEGDVAAIEDFNSILEAAKPIFTNRRLRWHYRSKHESLIAFSNKHFYDGDLVIFPSPFDLSTEFGVKNHRVKRGRFLNNRNVEEAQEVAKVAATHLIDNPHESLGIVAMNVYQRDEIEKQLDQLAKDCPALLEAYDRNKSSEEPIFIKNIENVQGDERDVIYISMTYGPEQIGGRTMQRFGPINSNMGWRRLNVLFTRSKKRMHIFCSMDSGDIILSPESNRGVKSLRAFLEYTETGHLNQNLLTGRVPDSDFELAVIQILEERGYKCEPQLGMAGYFLDIAVRDPGKPGKFLMGIECDGATYHSAKSARDRDCLRQEILESLGWKIRRIWSTDWFIDPLEQIRPILDELETLKTPISEEQKVVDDRFKEADLELAAKVINSHVESEKVHPITTTTIENRLLLFDSEVIRPEFPKTEENKRLLRGEMLSVLLHHLPTSKAEFQELVPHYLRAGTSTQEAKFLDDILNIIADYAA